MAYLDPAAGRAREAGASSGAAIPTFTNAGSPSNGTSGTLAGIAPPGSLLVDTTNKLLYQNTNTQASPTWTQREGTAGVATADIADAAITADKLAAAVAGAGLAGGAGTALSVTVDDSTLEISSDTVRAKDGGISTAKLAVPKIAKISQTVLISAFTDGGGASGTINLATQIPAGAIFQYARVLVNVALSGDTTAVLTIGDGSDVDRYNTGTPSVLTTGQKDMGLPSGARDHLVATTVTLTVTGGSDFGLVNALGSLTVDLYYLQTV